MTSSMAMYFTTTKNTPLWSTAWTPNTEAQYAGTCIFLIIFAVVSRGLATIRFKFEQKWHDSAINRRYITVADKEGVEAPLGKTFRDESIGGILTVRGMDESVQIVRTKTRTGEGVAFRLSEDMARAGIYVVSAGVGYLL